MLELHHNGTFIRLVPAGGWLELPDGRWVSPATAGWESDDGYSLVEHVAPEPEGPTLDDQIINAPYDLFGGPTLGEIYHGN